MALIPKHRVHGRLHWGTVGSRYPVFKRSDLNSHGRYGYGNQKPQRFCAWIFRGRYLKTDAAARDYRTKDRKWCKLYRIMTVRARTGTLHFRVLRILRGSFLRSSSSHEIHGRKQVHTPSQKHHSKYGHRLMCKRLGSYLPVDGLLNNYSRCHRSRFLRHQLCQPRLHQQVVVTTLIPEVRTILAQNGEQEPNRPLFYIRLGDFCHLKDPGKMALECASGPYTILGL